MLPSLSLHPKYIRLRALILRLSRKRRSVAVAHLEAMERRERAEAPLSEVHREQ